MLRRIIAANRLYLRQQVGKGSQEIVFIEDTALPFTTVPGQQRDGELKHFFNDILGGDTVAQCKPSPAPLLAAIERAGASAATTVMIGDSSNDFDAARAAGVRSIACAFGFGEPWEMERADVRIDSLEVLLPLPF